MPKLRSSALNHLKLAAAQLPEIAEAQARYGVALVLAGEQNLGRQFLQNALRLGSLDPQYQLWAAWTVLQAGYPEEAEPIVSSLFQQVAAGTAPRELTLGALSLERRDIPEPADAEEPAEGRGRVRESRSPPAPNRARPSWFGWRRSTFSSASMTGRSPASMHRQTGQGKPERRAARGLDAGRARQETRSTSHGCKAARTRYPRSPELAGLEAALVAKDGKAGRGRPDPR